jgi:F-type H+-transporting ATPase subunit gamma
MESFRPYAKKFAEVLESIAEKSKENANSLLTPRENVKKINIVLCTSDRGLCGGFNNNLVDKATKIFKEKLDQEAEVTFTCFGKKGRDWCRNQQLIIDKEYIGIVGGNFGFNVASKAGRKLIDDFNSGVYDEVYIIYAEFLSMGKQVPGIKQIIPIQPIETENEDENEDIDEPETYMAEHICEPSASELLDEMLPRNIYVQIYSALLETSTSEHAARMMAMDNATNACNDMVDNLTLVYNKARQAAITADLMDIVGGAEALKG